ncbi:hypothetical protein CsSME_00029431 [Camellia sinensis var. sinensis]
MLLQVSAVFSLAYKLQPAIIFIDEVDSFLGQRRTTDHEALTNMKTEFMALWDGFTTDQNARVMVLAATNRPSELDEAILRRLPQAFEIGIPDRRERVEILKVVLKGERVEEDIDFAYIAGLCEGYTGSDLLELCKKAAYYPIRDLLNEEKKGKSSPVSILFFLMFHHLVSFFFFLFDRMLQLKKSVFNICIHPVWFCYFCQTNLYFPKKKFRKQISENKKQIEDDNLLLS